MGYTDRYKTYLSQVSRDIVQLKKSSKKFIFGYTSDLDVVLEWNTEAFNTIISEHLKTTPSVKDGDVIDSMESFARIVSYYVLNGLGGEVEIIENSICELLESAFKHTFALGGTGAQGGAALSAMGFPVLMHITDMSKEVCDLLDRPGVDVVTPKGTKPIIEAASDELPIRHIILQYTKGEKINICGKEYEVPLSNRLIMDYDKVHKRLPIKSAFINYCEKHAKDILAYSVSGFNAIIDAEIMSRHADELYAHFNRIKEKNENAIIYLEGAYYLNSDVKNLVFDKLARSIDILGMNEEELVDHTEKHGVMTDKDDIESVLNGLELLLDIYPAKGIVLHTKDYSMYCGDELPGIDYEKGLTLGNLMSGTRARIGEYGTIEDCEATLSLGLSETGCAFAKALTGKATDKQVYLVPSRYMEQPKFTIGLGDTFMAGFMLAAMNDEVH